MKRSPCCSPARVSTAEKVGRAVAITAFTAILLLMLAVVVLGALWLCVKIVGAM